VVNVFLVCLLALLCICRSQVLVMALTTEKGTTWTVQEVNGAPEVGRQGRRLIASGVAGM
jgi:hypothetical protein